MSFNCSNCQTALSDDQATCPACGSIRRADSEAHHVPSQAPSFRRSGYHLPHQGQNVYLETIYDGLYSDDYPASR